METESTGITDQEREATYKELDAWVKREMSAYNWHMTIGIIGAIVTFLLFISTFISWVTQYKNFIQSL